MLCLQAAHIPEISAIPYVTQRPVISEGNLCQVVAH